MKSYRWLTLIAALLITVSEVLFFESQADQAPPEQAHVAAGRDVGGDTHSLAVSDGMKTKSTTPGAAQASCSPRCWPQCWSTTSRRHHRRCATCG